MKFFNKYKKNQKEIEEKIKILTDKELQEKAGTNQPIIKEDIGLEEHNYSSNGFEKLRYG